MSFRCFPAIVAAAVSLVSPVRAALTDNLEVYLDFDGNVANRAPGPYPATTTGPVPPRFAPGRFGSCADFQGHHGDGAPTDDWAVILPASLDEVYRKDWSLSLWVKADSKGDGALLGNKNWKSGANTGWAISPIKGGSRGEKQGLVNWRVAGGLRRDARFDADRSFVSDGWRHLAVTFDRTRNRVSVYLDGERVNAESNNDFGTPDAAKAVLDAGLGTAIGASGAGNWGVTARIDDVAIWSRVLTTEEIRQLGRHPVRNIPEPGTYGLIGAGALAAVAVARRRRLAQLSETGWKRKFE